MQRPRRLIPICGHPRRQRMQLADWLARLETPHPNAIALGLERVRRVRDALPAQWKVLEKLQAAHLPSGSV